MRGRPHGERGAATVLVLSLCSVVVLAGTIASGLGAVAVARHRAAAAADLAALAAAARVAEGAGPACAAGRRVAEAAGAVLTSCVVRGRDVVVQAQLRPPGALGRLGAAAVVARAGPVSSGSGVRRPSPEVASAGR